MSRRGGRIDHGGNTSEKRRVGRHAGIVVEVVVSGDGRETVGVRPHTVVDKGGDESYVWSSDNESKLDYSDVLSSEIFNDLTSKLSLLSSIPSKWILIGQGSQPTCFNGINTYVTVKRHWNNRKTKDTAATQREFQKQWDVVFVVGLKMFGPGALSMGPVLCVVAQTERKAYASILCHRSFLHTPR